MKTNSLTFILDKHETEFLINDIFYHESDAIEHLRKTIPEYSYEDRISEGIMSTVFINDRILNKIKKQGHFFVSFNPKLNKFGYPTPILIRNSKITILNDHKRIVDNDATEKTLFHTDKNVSLCWAIQIR